ncbi:MAG: DNA repair protein RecN [Saprospiraceae bacterium]
MIQRLFVKNYAIIDELEINFSDKLTIITGETGAGKSILLGALGLIMGKRADTKSLYKEDKKCIIEGLFDVSKYDLKSFFETKDIDYDDDLVVRREITPSGKSRAFVNDTPVNLKVLQQLSASLIDLHQQFDTLDIHNISFQLRMIDSLAENQKYLDIYQKSFKTYQQHKKELAKLIHQSETAANEMDFLSFQLEEFNQVSLLTGEQEKMEAEQAQLSNAEDIKRQLNSAFQQLSESEQSVLANLESIGYAINDLKQYHPSLQKAGERFDSVVIELQDLAQEFEQIADDTEYNPARIEELQNRLDLIYKLQNKHRVKTIDELITIQEGLQNRLNNFEDISSSIERLEKSIAEEEVKLKKQAAVLTKNRAAVIPSFEKKVHKLLAYLSMEHARLKVEISSLDHFNNTGLDEINFLFAPNKGSRFSSIKEVASGGEISRLTLCTKSLVASAIPLPTLIFDEIDTGISGDVALQMGKILQRLSKQHQVVSITHTPQIAVKADTHYFVYKKTEKDRTITRVKLLGEEDRIKAIATMLSGSPPSNSAIENAKELLAQ